MFLVIQLHINCCWCEILIVVLFIYLFIYCCFSFQDLPGSTLPPPLSGLELPPQWQDFLSEFDVSVYALSSIQD